MSNRFNHIFCKIKAREEYIVESRKVMEEQDAAYAESLRIDQEKDAKKADKMAREKVRFFFLFVFFCFFLFFVFFLAFPTFQC